MVTSVRLLLTVGISVICDVEMLVEAPVFTTEVNFEVGAAMTTEDSSCSVSGFSWAVDHVVTIDVGNGCVLRTGRGVDGDNRSTCQRFAVLILDVSGHAGGSDLSEGRYSDKGCQ